jgi:hypothetical protein
LNPQGDRFLIDPQRVVDEQVGGAMMQRGLLGARQGVQNVAAHARIALGFGLGQKCRKRRVVFHFDDEFSAELVGRQLDAASSGFAARLPQTSIFDAVINRIADEMNQRVREAFVDGFVDLSVLSLGHKLDLFFQDPARVAHDALHFLKHGL